MCLFIKTSRKDYIDRKFVKPKIAKKEIKVYKVLDAVEGEYFSPYKCFQYHKGYQYTTKMSTSFYSISWLNEINYYFKVEEGLHAYRNVSEIKRLYCFGEREVIVEMYIPVGAEYYIGDDGDIVSTDLIWYPDAKVHKI